MTTDTQTVTIERSYSATPEQIWRAWTDPDVLSRWFGCAADQLWTIHRWEPTVGGRLHVSMDFDGVPYEVTGEFLAVERPRRLRYSFGGDQIVSVDIAPRGTETLVTIQHEGLDVDLRSTVTDGWSHGVEQLDAIVCREIA